MAVTEQAYTGNGSATNYSFTFPYLKSTDIQVQLNASVTTNWSLANATTIQFTAPSGGATTTQETGGAPKSGVAIKILRDTNVDNLTATFYAGSSIKSEDLNDNFTQNLYVTQEIGNRSFENTGTSTMIGNLNMGEDTTIVFEGATDNTNETTLTVADPTADRTITLPDVSGTVVTTGDTATVTATMMAANSVDSSELVDGSVDLSHMSANSVDSDQYVDGSIDLIHMSANSVDSDQYVDGSIDLAHMSANSVDSDQYVDGSIDLAHMSANSVDSDQYVDGSIDRVHLEADIIDGTKLADNAVNSEHITAGSVDLAHMSANSVDSDQYVDGSIDRVHLEADIIDSTKLADNAVGTEHIADAELTTLAGMQSGTASILAGGTALTATLAEINTVVDGKSVETTISDTDAAYPTSGAVVDYVAAQIAPIGGLEVIATDAAFPNTQPAAGVVISIADAGGLVVNGSGTSTTGRTVGGSTVTINNIASNFNSSTVDAGVAFMVSSTGSGQIYNYHKATLKEADLLNLSNDINDFGNRYRVNAGEPTSNNDEGDLCYDTNADKMKVYDSSTSAWKEVTSTGDFKYLFLCPAGGSGAPTLNGSIATYDLRETTNSGSAASVTSAAQLLVSINGVVQKANTGTSAPAEGFALVDANTIIFGSNLASGDSVFIIQFGSALTITTPGDNTVAEAKLQTNSVSEEKLKVSNSPTNGHFLSAQSGNSGGLTWASADDATKMPLAGGTFTGDVTFDNQSTAGQDIRWDESTSSFELDDNVALWFGDGRDFSISHTNNINYMTVQQGPIWINAGAGIDVNTGANNTTLTSPVNLKAYTTGTGGRVGLRCGIGSGTGSDREVQLEGPATMAATYRMILPQAAPTTTGQALTATTAGVCSWGNVESTKAGGAIYENSNTISATHTLTADTNGMSAGPITVNNGITLTIPSGASYTIV